MAADTIVMNMHQQGSKTVVLRTDLAGREFMLVHDCRLYQSMHQLDPWTIIFRHVPFMATRFVISSRKNAAVGKVILSIETEDGTMCIGTETFHCIDRMATVHIRINAMLVDNNIMTRQTYIELKGNFNGNAYIATACALNPDSVWPYSLRNYCADNQQKRIKSVLNPDAGFNAPSHMSLSMKRSLFVDDATVDPYVPCRFWEFAVVHNDCMPLRKCFREVDAATQRQLATTSDMILMNKRQRGFRQYEVVFVLRRDPAGLEFMRVHDCLLYISLDHIDQRNFIFRRVQTMSTRFVISSFTDDESAETVTVSVATDDGRTWIGTETFHHAHRMSWVHICINAMLVGNNIMTSQTYLMLQGNFTGNTQIGTALAVNSSSVWPYILRNYCSNQQQIRIKTELMTGSGVSR